MGKYLMFDSGSLCRRPVRASAERIQERGGHARAARFLRRRSEARLLRRRRASTRASTTTRSRSRCTDCRRTRRAGARNTRSALRESFTRTHVRCSCTRHLAAAGDATASRSIPTLKDAWGLPAMRVTFKDHPTICKTMQVSAGARRWRSCDAAGAREDAGRIRVDGTTTLRVHLLGTCRMGNDPRPRWWTATTARTTCRTCSGGRQQLRHLGPEPADLTIQALAYRAADHLAKSSLR